jgi:hypothetical protein
VLFGRAQARRTSSLTAQIEQASAKYDYQAQLQVLKYQNGSLR